MWCGLLLSRKLSVNYSANEGPYLRFLAPISNIYFPAPLLYFRVNINLQKKKNFFILSIFMSCTHVRKIAAFVKIAPRSAAREPLPLRWVNSGKLLSRVWVNAPRSSHATRWPHHLFIFSTRLISSAAGSRPDLGRVAWSCHRATRFESAAFFFFFRLHIRFTIYILRKETIRESVKDRPARGLIFRILS